jgi:hypothetical protein
MHDFEIAVDAAHSRAGSCNLELYQFLPFSPSAANQQPNLSYKLQLYAPEAVAPVERASN